jgi:hypothetical protein
MEHVRRVWVGSLAQIPDPGGDHVCAQLERVRSYRPAEAEVVFQVPRSTKSKHVHRSGVTM